MEFDYTDGGFGPEMIRIEKRCTSCGEMFSKDVSKESSKRHRLCYCCRTRGWMPVIHTLRIDRRDGVRDG